MSAFNILSIDVEDYFMVSAFEGVVGRESWDRYESRVERNTYRVLDTLEDAANGGDRTGAGRTAPIRGTFFCLGWVAERFPGLIREIGARGHEVASHGYEHRTITSMTPGQFREDLRRAKGILEGLTGGPVLGYRAPSYTITDSTLWALDILVEEGFRYDSSIFPIHHDRYGIPDAPRFPFFVYKNGSEKHEYTPVRPEDAHRHAPGLHSNGSGGGSARGMLVPSRTPGTEPPAGSLVEFPVSTLRLLGRNIPVAGGGYFRFFPFPFVRWAAKRIHERDRLPFIFYLHPWEIDPGQPRISGLSVRSRFRHYLNLDRTENRLKLLLRSGLPFTSFRDYLEVL